MDDEEAGFARIWANRSKRVIVLDVPDAARRDLMRFMPESDTPARLKASGPSPALADPEHAALPPGMSPPTALPPNDPDPSPAKAPSAETPPAETPADDPRSRVWAFIARAPSLPGGGIRVGEATAAVTPWPHQIKAFERLYRHWPPRLLIADEVGLGKTIQAGLLLRQAWLSGRAQRILVLAPKAVLGQWQIELREKFNLHWPIYDGRHLVRYPSPAWRGRHRTEADRHRWHEEPAVIASSHLMRRRDRAKGLLEDAAPWDLVILDEAHHARRRAAGAAQEGGPNALLRLMRGLAGRTRGLVLLTATPMQVHPVEVWDLLHLLGLPPEWSADAFLRFFEDLEQPSPSSRALDRMAGLFRAVERSWGEVATEDAQRLTALSRFKANKVLRALRDPASIPRRQLETEERRAALRIVQAHTPDPAAGLAAYAGAVAPLLQGRDADHPDRRALGGRSLHRHERRGAGALRRGRGVHRKHLEPGGRRRTHRGGIRDDHLPPSAGEQLPCPARHPAEASRRHRGGRPGPPGRLGRGRPRRRNHGRNAGRRRDRRAGAAGAGRRRSARRRAPARRHRPPPARQQARLPEASARRAERSRLRADDGVHPVHRHHGLSAGGAARGGRADAMRRDRAANATRGGRAASATWRGRFANATRRGRTASATWRDRAANATRRDRAASATWRDRFASAARRDQAAKRCVARPAPA